MLTCAACGAANANEARFCSSCGASLFTSADGESRRLVTVLFCDLEDSTLLGSRLDPESLRRVVTRYFEESRTAVGRHGGTVEKFIGDAVMAVFGVPVLHEDDALRAIRAAMDMHEALETLNDELEHDWGVRLQHRIGVSSGEVVAADPVGGQSFVTGECVNLASRLEASATAGTILLGEDTYRLVRDAVTTEAIELVQVKGFGDVRAYRLLEVIPGVPGHARRLDSPLVGRGQETALLQDAFERMIAGHRCQMATVLGAAGVGKSRLVDEFLSWVGGRATAYRGRCLAYGEGITFWPVIDVVNQAAGLTDQDSAEQAKTKILGVLGGAPGDMVAAERIAQAVGIAATPGVPEETFWAIRTLCESLAQRQPIVLLFDDIHWGEPTFLELIEHIADWSRDAPIMLLCLARPDLLESNQSWGGGKLNATSLFLEPLTGEESDTLIRNLLGAAELAPPVRERIVDAAGGNPLFVEEILSMLIDDGLLIREGDRWISIGDLTRLSIPPTISSLLTARLGRLASDERTVIERAAVIGKEFSVRALSALLPPELAEDVRPSLTALVRKEHLRPARSTEPDGERYRFRHILIRDAAYESLPKHLRAELHQRFADWLAQRMNRAEEYEDFLGYHFEQAYRYLTELGPVDDHGRALARKAGTHLAAAGRGAYARGDVPATVSLLQRASRLLPADDPSRGQFMPELADSLAQRGHGAEVAAVHDELLRFARRAGDRSLEMIARLEADYLRFLVEPSAQAVERLREEAEEAIRANEGSRDPGRLATSFVYLALTHWYSGAIDEMLDVSERAMELASRAGETRALLWAVSSMGTALLLGSTPCDRSLERLESALSAFPEPRMVRANILLDIARVLGMVGRLDEAARHAIEARETFKDLGQQGWLAQAALTVGTIAAWSGDLEVGENETRTGYLHFHDSGDPSNVALAARDMARVLFARGSVDEAGRFAGEVMDVTGEYDLEPQIEGRSILAMVRSKEGALEEAELLARDALSMVEPTQFLNLHAEVLSDLATVLVAAHRNDDARHAAEESLRLFYRKGNLMGVSRARGILGYLDD